MFYNLLQDGENSGLKEKGAGALAQQREGVGTPSVGGEKVDVGVGGPANEEDVAVKGGVLVQERRWQVLFYGPQVCYLNCCLVTSL